MTEGNLLTIPTMRSALTVFKVLLYMKVSESRLLTSPFPSALPQSVLSYLLCMSGNQYCREK